jgi:hypothetical protein
MKQIYIQILIGLLFINIVCISDMIFHFSPFVYQFISISISDSSFNPFIPEKSLQVLGKNKMEIRIPRNFFSFAGEGIAGMVDKTG